MLNSSSRVQWLLVASCCYLLKMADEWKLFLFPLSLFVVFCLVGKDFGATSATTTTHQSFLEKSRLLLNNVSFVYIVGIEGSGLNTIIPAVSLIAKTCNQHVIIWKGSQHGSYQHFAQTVKKSKYDTANVVVIDHRIFPVNDTLVHSSLLEKKAFHIYNIEWVFDQMAATEVPAKFLFLNRDFYQTIAAHTQPPQQNQGELYATFQERVNTTRDFLLHIGAEYDRIEEKQRGLWKQVQFEWFVDPSKCPGLVAALVEFLGFEVCDVNYACELLQERIEAPALHDANEISNRYAANMSVTLPIPMLDITERKSYAFTTYISDRKHVKTASNDSHQSPLAHKGENVTREVRNNVSLLYIAGVEGVGHHGVTPAMISIAKACNYHVLHASAYTRSFRTFQGQRLSHQYQSFIDKLKYADLRSSTNTSITNVLIIDDQSFPTNQEKRISTAEEKKSSGKYDLEWVYNQSLALNVGINFIYLRRDFYRAVASHPEFDKGFETHARVLHDFIWYIYSEYEAIERKQKGLWAQVHYEWFTEMANCTALVSAVIEHLHFDHCDVEFACTMLSSMVRPQRNRDGNSAELAYAQSFATDLPIPTLDISPKDSYKFNTV